MPAISCFRCQHKWTYDSVLGRGDECPACNFDAHVCMNCELYDKNAHHECREPQAEYVKDKERSNFCDYFSPLGSHAGVSGEADQAKSQLEALFGGGKKDEPAPKKSKTLADDLQEFLKNK